MDPGLTVLRFPLPVCHEAVVIEHLRTTDRTLGGVLVNVSFLLWWYDGGNFSSFFRYEEYVHVSPPTGHINHYRKYIFLINEKACPTLGPHAGILYRIDSIILSANSH